MINFLKHETAFSKQLGNGAVILDVLVNLAECYSNAMKAYEDYENQMRLARTIGHQRFHGWNLRGSGNSASYASRKAFEHAVSTTSAGKAKVKIDLVDFSRAINSETEARNWGIRMREKTAQLTTDLKAAEKTLKDYADQYSVEMAKLAAKYKLMVPHQAKLLKSWKAIVDYESKNYSHGRRSDILSHSHGYLRSELIHYDEALAKAQSRLEIPAAMSEARLHSY